MSTTEQATQQDDIIEPLPVKTVFASRGLHLTLERIRPRRIVDAGGSHHWTEGVSYEFIDGMLTVYPGQDVHADKFDPDTGQMEEQDALSWLRGHELYNLERGFWEVAPIAPDPAPVLATILQLAVKAGDPEHREDAEERIANIHEAEGHTWKRQVVLDQCVQALAAIDSARTLEPPPADDQPHGATRGAMPAPPPPPDPANAPRTLPEGMKLTTIGGFNPESAPPKEA